MDCIFMMIHFDYDAIGKSNELNLESCVEHMLLHYGFYG